jgi:transposase
MSKLLFKQDNQGEILLFPERLDKNISATHLVRVINRIVNTLDISNLLSGYSGGGTSSCHPRMLLKVLLYACCLKIYSGRKIADALDRDITFMWLFGKQTPNFRTLNNFRSSRLKGSMDAIFKSLLYFMFEEGHLRFEEYYCDGTTIQAEASKHKVTWKKNSERHRSTVEFRIVIKH